ncbi:hypothetical protein [Saccharomonospora sp. NB11]|jgi:hypothetical protein|uniref:hypothetical protein n=1 Tax=Saccharomonospora sp. NB11 TaxID=1642298 RepID=UPI0018D1F5F0|nr:hypothetical protein [Saccharomonospora sp. NB11]
MMLDYDDELAPDEDSIVLIPVRRRPDGTLTTEAGTPVDLDADELPSPVVQELAASAIHLTAGEDLSSEALADLGRLPVPECFTRSGWLAGYHVLVLDRDTATVGAVAFHVDAEGVVIGP